MTAAGHGVIVNGTMLCLDGTDPATSALDVLRTAGLTGAKEGCAEGECGACAVMVLRPDDPLVNRSDAAGAPAPGLPCSRWVAVNACLVPAASLDGQEVVTAEGLGTPGALHPVQHEMAVRGGSQCGYCTPGFVCSMAAEFYRADRHPAPGLTDSTEHGANGFDLSALSGNLCRCTGYRPIRDAAYALGRPAADDALAERTDRLAPPAVRTRMSGVSGTFERATDLSGLLELLTEHPDAVLVAGSTDWGVEVNLHGARALFVIGMDRVAELRELQVGDDVVEIGAALSLSEVEHRLAGVVPLLDELYPQFASRLIRNGATIGGNLATASPIGDTAPALLALEASVVLASLEGEREVRLADFFTGYRSTVRRADEVIRTVRIPRPLSEVVSFHKIAKRRFDDISSVAAGIALDVRDGVVAKARIGLGGVAATPVRAFATEAALQGQPWTGDVARAAGAVMCTEGTPIDDHRASAAYRSAMLGTALPRLHARTVDRGEDGS